jgi:putative MATE family efflux protein
MGASAHVIEQGSTFTRIMLGGSSVIVLLFLLNGIFRGAGNAAIAMRSLWLASGLNILLCPILIYGFDLGLKGAAIATTIGRGAGVLYQVYFLFVKPGVIRFKQTDFKPRFIIIRQLIDIAWPATFQFIIASASWIVLAKLVAETGGTIASAGYQIAIRNVVFFILPAWGLSNAAATLVGQHLGATKPERAEQSVMLCVKYNVLFMSLVTLVFVFFPGTIIAWYSKDLAVIEVGTQALRTIGYGYIFYGIGMVMIQGLNGAGDTKTPTVIHFVCFWLFQIPLAYFLSRPNMLGIQGIFWAIPIAETLIAIVAYLLFRQGKWKQVKV